MLVSTINFLQSIIIGWLSVPLNMILYLGMHGQAPPRPPSGDTRGPDYWLGYFVFVLPWWYFATTGIILLAVAVLLVVRPQYRFTPASLRVIAWRTTPGFLAVMGFVVAFALFTVALYHAELSSATDPYLIGTYAAAVGGIFSLAAFLGTRSRRPARRRPTQRKAASRG